MSNHTPSQLADAHEGAAEHASAAGKGIASLVLCGVALVCAPMLLLIPYIGFVPGLLALAAVIVAWHGLRSARRGHRTAVAGLIIGVVLLAVFVGIATVWNFMVADPAIRDYDELHEVFDYIKKLIFG
ncbi:hypothetical protein [Enemella sp. A6]|uniref:hypothetical protein n=1 Tax=Enemella sp. A6 TaxID=3440152 RepID=UPI003EBCCAEB